MYQYAHDDVTDFEIYTDFTKTQKSRYLENETFIFLQIKINYTSKATTFFCSGDSL